MNGYTWCACRDCFDVVVTDGLCSTCGEAGCAVPQDSDAPRLSYQLDCQRSDAYGVGDEEENGA